MNPVLPDEAVEFGATASRAFTALGGVEVARAAEEAPARRATDVAAVLRSLGIEHLDPRADADALAASAALCEAAGRVALPYPLPAVLLKDAQGRPFATIPSDRPLVDHGDLFDRWTVAPLYGPAQTAATAGPYRGSRLGPFVAPVAPDGAGDPSPRTEVALHLTLTAWQVLGSVDRAVELTVAHVTSRQQFGKPLSAFQAVQFQLADAAVAVAGLRELAQFTLWRLVVAPHGALADVLALRLHALDVARPVLRTCQQLHGAAGVCDEYDVSVLTRHVQPALRLPMSAERTAAALAAAVQVDGFDGLFAHGGAPA